jgi:hypothetical protein
MKELKKKKYQKPEIKQVKIKYSAPLLEQSEIPVYVVPRP